MFTSKDLNADSEMSLFENVLKVEILLDPSKVMHQLLKTHFLYGKKRGIKPNDQQSQS